MAQSMQNNPMDDMMDNVTFLDLHQPWLVSPAR
jgi:hypothetical protein